MELSITLPLIFRIKTNTDRITPNPLSSINAIYVDPFIKNQYDESNDKASIAELLKGESGTIPSL